MSNNQAADQPPGQMRGMGRGAALLSKLKSSKEIVKPIAATGQSSPHASCTSPSPTPATFASRGPLSSTPKDALSPTTGVGTPTPPPVTYRLPHAGPSPALPSTSQNSPTTRTILHASAATPSSRLSALANLRSLATPQKSKITQSLSRAVSDYREISSFGTKTQSMTSSVSTDRTASVTSQSSDPSLKSQPGITTERIGKLDPSTLKVNLWILA